MWNETVYCLVIIFIRYLYLLCSPAIASNGDINALESLISDSSVCGHADTTALHSGAKLSAHWIPFDTISTSYTNYIYALFQILSLCYKY